MLTRYWVISFIFFPFIAFASIQFKVTEQDLMRMSEAHLFFKLQKELDSGSSLGMTRTELDSGSRSTMTITHKNYLSLGLAARYFKKNEYDKALATLKNIKLKNFDLQEYVYFYFGKVYFAQNKLTPSLHFLNLIPEKTWLNLEDLYRLKADIYFYKKDTETALSYYQKYFKTFNERTILQYEERKKRVFYPLLRLAMLLEPQEPQTSQDLFKRINIEFPEESPEFILRKLTLLSKKTKIPIFTTPDFFHKAENLFKVRRYDEASELYLKYLDLSKPKDEYVVPSLGKLENIYKLKGDKEGRKKMAALLHKHEAKHSETETKQNLLKLAYVYWNQDQAPQALKALEEVVRKGTHNERNEARIVKAKMMAQQRKFKEAIKILKLTDSYLKKEQREERLYLLGWYYYLNQQYKEAAEEFLSLTRKNKSSPYFLQSLYWGAEALQKVSSSQKKSEEITAQVLKEDPFSYYAYLISYEKRLPRKKAPPSSLKFDFKEDVLKYYNIHESWLHKTVALLKAHLYEEAKQALDEAFLQEDEQKLTWELKIFKASLYALSKNYLKTIIILNTLNISELPSFVLKCLYPRPFWETVTKHAEKSELSPYLLLSMMRQESAFNEQARSPADAMGLLQILPQTRRALAAELDETQKDLDLFDADTNLYYATVLIKNLLKKYDNNLILTLAAYNAGEPTVDKWRKMIKKVDARELIEMIPYAETRGYIKLVLRNYHNYLQIYENKVLPPVYKLYTNYQKTLILPK